MSSFSRLSRLLAPGVVAVVAMTVAYFLARVPTASAETRQEMAADYKFTKLPIALPPGYMPAQRLRQVNPNYEQIQAWISAVGASIAMTDLDGSGRTNDLCFVDTRTDKVVVTYAPTAAAADRFTPFVLDASAHLPMDDGMAPMGCTPGDFNLDGRMDLMVSYWGRTPILFLAKAGATGLTNDTYHPVELVPYESGDGQYHGPRWNTNATLVNDLHGSGRPDIVIANYFPDSDVLDPEGQPNVEMNSSLSNAKNGGGAHVLRWLGATAGDMPTAKYVEDKDAVPYDVSTGWTLGISSADLTGDGMPEVYIANDFGKDHLLYNTSEPGEIKFEVTEGERSPTTAKSFQLGHSSFKGMGIDFADLDSSGRFDMVVSNITTAWGLEESNFLWDNEAATEGDAKSQMAKGEAPFTQRAQERGFAWTGWGWDVKAADFRNSGQLEIVQAEGFVKGKINRWPWLQEMAMNNDNVFSNPKMWPTVGINDDLAGNEPFAFYAQGADDRFVNINKELGMKDGTPTRGIAIGDTTGSGKLDFAVARQWDAPNFYANQSPNVGNALNLKFYRPVSGPAGGLQAAGTPAYGTTVKITTPDGRSQVSKLDGGGGHSGKRTFDVHFGLGKNTDPVTVSVMWCENNKMFEQQLKLAPGEHSLVLGGGTAKEVTPK